MMVRELVVDGESWWVWSSGGGAYGTGALGLGVIQAIHFGRPVAPETPVFEALLPAGALESLFDDELIALFRSARRVVDAGSAGQRTARRTRSLG